LYAPGEHQTTEGDLTKSGTFLQAIGTYTAIIVLAVPGLAFAVYSARLGLRGLGTDLSAETYIFTPDRPILNAAIFGHMVLGGVMMALAPVQLVPWLRSRYPVIHRAIGRLTILMAMAVALAGLVYIATRGTIGGPLMDVGFGLYGALMFGAAVQTLRWARSGNVRQHMNWALRLLVLVMGSLLFRLHYAIWYTATGGVWSNEQLTGPFDQAQYFAFYLPYLTMIEIWIRRRSA
jgi:hypothetical protein